MKKVFLFSVRVGLSCVLCAVVLFLVLNWDALFVRMHSIAQVAQPQAASVVAVASSGADDPGHLFIPRIGVRAPVIWSESALDEDMQQDLMRGVAHDPRSALPDEAGMVFLTGHSSGSPLVPRAAKTVFTNLEKLAAADQIELSWGNAVYRYRVTTSSVIAATDISQFDFMRPLGAKDSQQKSPELVLMTCWPLGTSWKRFIVRAALDGIYTPAGDLISKTVPVSDEST